MMYTVYFVVCMFTPLNHVANADQCVQVTRPLSFPSYQECLGRLKFIRTHYSTREGQEELFQETTLPHLTDGKLHITAECRVPVWKEYLQCVDCSS
jgi:hypothetical protein